MTRNITRFACLVSLLVFLGSPAISVVADTQDDWQAQWIWRSNDGDDFNKWMLARQTIDVVGCLREARLLVSADTLYRAYINGRFVSDGPVRAFPQHYRYDTIDVSRFLVSGENVIGCRVHHWGRDTAKNVAVRPGLLAQLEWTDEAGHHVVGTDESWRVHDEPAYDPRSPMVSAHLGFEEQYDARRAIDGWLDSEFDDADWEVPHRIAAAHEGPWLDLRPREIPQLDRVPVHPVAVRAVKRVRPPRLVTTVNLGRCQGIDRKASARNFHRFVLVTVLDSPIQQEAEVFRPSAAFEFGNYRFPHDTLDVKNDLLQQEGASVMLDKGENLLIVVLDGPSEVEEFQFCLDAKSPITMRNPFGDGCWSVAGPYGPKDARWHKLRAARTLSELQPLQKLFRDLESREVIGTDVHALTCFRTVLGSADVANANALLHNTEQTTVLPAGDDHLELTIDLGSEINAHMALEIDAPAGVVIDGNIFERFHEGRPQWSWRNRSSFRYITREGWQTYETIRHFGGRYLTLTIRERPVEVRIRRIYGVFTHYPVADRGSFHGSDSLLNAVWSISRQTMLACMEDTFVDCPLYEQSLWLGDARNEALVCYRMFGDAGLVRRCCTLGAESLEHQDLAAMRAPTRWGRIIPAWSFLWLRMCWENYWFTGDQRTLTEVYYPAGRRMLDNCLEKYIDAETGLFSIRAWQFFDWIALDNGHLCVTHNNTFLVDSLRLGAHMADVAGDLENAQRYRAAATRLTDAINSRLWSETRGAYVDSLHDDGTQSTSVSRQINTLALLHGVVPPARRERVECIALTDGQQGVVQFGSPFATLYLLELQGETGRIESMLDVIRDKWGGMMDDQTTTFWESFAEGNLGGRRYPTRSYCHAWSSGAAYALSRYVLGARFDEAGGKVVTLTPRVDVLPQASGTVPLNETGAHLDLSWQTTEPDSVQLVLQFEGDAHVGLVAPDGWQLGGHDSEPLPALEPGRQYTFILSRERQDDDACR